MKKVKILQESAHFGRIRIIEHNELLYLYTNIFERKTKWQSFITKKEIHCFPCIVTMIFLLSFLCDNCKWDDFQDNNNIIWCKNKISFASKKKNSSNKSVVIAVIWVHSVRIMCGNVQVFRKFVWIDALN